MTGDRADCWAVIAAAGVGRRFGAARPKQYLDLAGRPVIEHAVRPLLGNPRIRGLVVALDPADGYWAETRLAADRRIRRADGGDERCHSVLNALELLAGEADPDDWVLVHDAARPCLSAEELESLFTALANDPVGGLLAVPLADTLKAADESGRVSRTLPRDGLWRALTPQMFRYGLLRKSLADAIAAGVVVTDEAAAIEYSGHRPALVAGRAANLKVTGPEDLALAEAVLRRRGEK